MATQRFRVFFRKGERVRFISHLDVLRFWERAIRRAGLPLSYSQGFTPHPKLAFAAPLPLGFTGEAEIMDVTLDERVDSREFFDRLSAEASGELAILSAVEIPASAVSPQATMTWADYMVDLPGVEPATAAALIERFLELPSFPWTEARHEKAPRTYDLRSAVASLECRPLDGGTRLGMRLRASQELTSRPEHVVAALFPGAEATGYTRTGVVLDEPSPARDAWRRKGQFE